MRGFCVGADGGRFRFPLPVARLNNAGTMNKISPSCETKSGKEVTLGGDQTREACTLEQKKKKKSCAYRAYGDQPLERNLSRQRDKGSPRLYTSRGGRLFLARARGFSPLADSSKGVLHC